MAVLLRTNVPELVELLDRGLFGTQANPQLAEEALMVTMRAKQQQEAENLCQQIELLSSQTIMRMRSFAQIMSQQLRGT